MAHIQLEKSEKYQRVLVCGSPERAEKMSKLLENAKPVAKNREYHSYLGGHRGKDILIMSHGVGASGAAICFQELIDVGAKVMIRVGTAGGLYDETQIGDIVVATSAVRKDGVSLQMLPPEFPAVGDLEISRSLIEGLRSQGWAGKAGTVVTSDLFYPGLIDNQLELYSRAGAVAVEMEISVLYIISQLRRVKAGALLVLDGNPLKWKQGIYDPRPERLAASMETCFKAAFDTLAGAELNV
ncbi:MAG TPA: hypothetical protein DCS07_00395 [Bdellovibrionales bacterium]|nr:MAG: hypothetical protein A2Z97_15440 [Bdellovibrionales bacterium GWB1_52_6]OFZ04260.1 MAG: hypothetical protein A2X97_06325 [Bdellovibrionales bacterium GWA1_52_35]OFZ42919.1 MAG: hypothetical protein A2070_04630 [Bdellovibrionales bacterium GWC1_52_8]HAR41089.1 hypothetical protein [Bdellovibrionales bacterium]HCM40894.1 hypothetical protein [Bdellovibrionales bacterium]